MFSDKQSVGLSLRGVLNLSGSCTRDYLQ